MIVSMIRQFGLRLRADPEEIPFQYSSNIQMQFIKDENYNDYTVVGYYIPPGQHEAKLLSINDDGTFTLGPDCFKNRGTLSFSFNLINSQEEVHLGSIDFEVRYSFGDGDTILPEPEEVWISLVTQVAKDAIKEDVELVKQKANEALQSTSLANDKANEAQEYANNANQSANSASLSASSALTAKNDAIAASNSAIQAKQDAEQSANNAKNSANTALENANKSTEAIETVTQIKTEIENKANDFDTNYQEKLKSFNDNATSKQNAFDNSVQTANTNFDSKVTQANSDLDAKVQEANTIIDEKVKTATEQAQKATNEADRATQATDGKLDKNLGVENAGKSLVVGENGEVVCGESGINEDEVNKIIDKAIDEKLYTQEEVDYMLADKMDKPYVPIEITDSTTLNDCLAGNFKIDKIKGNTYQNVETDIKPTPERPVPINSRKVKANGEYVELRSLKESKNLFDKNIHGFKLGFLRNTGEVGNTNTFMVSDYIVVNPNTKYIYNLVDGFRNSTKLCFDKDKSVVADVSSIAFTTPANCYYVRYQIAANDNRALTEEDIKNANDNTMFVEGESLPSTYIQPTIRDYKIVNHETKTAKIIRNIGVANLTNLTWTYGSRDLNHIRCYAKPSTPLKFVEQYCYCNVFECNYSDRYDYSKEAIYLGNNMGGKTISIMANADVFAGQTQEQFDRLLKEYINNPNAITLYALETPTEEPITYVETDVSEVGYSWQDTTSPSPTIPSQIEGVNEIDITVTGKNLVNEYDNFTQLKSGTYCLSTNKSNVKTRLDFGLYDENKKLIRENIVSFVGSQFYLQLNGTYRLSNDANAIKSKITFDDERVKFIKIIYIDMYVKFDEIQLEVGDTATTYEPYQATTISCELTTPLRGIGDVTDIIDIENSVIQRNIGVIEFDGSSDEDWRYDSLNYNMTTRFYGLLDTAVDNNHVINYNYKTMCDKFVVKPGDIVDEEYFRISCGQENKQYYFVYLKKSRLDELSNAAFKTWLASNPITIWYELIEPTTEPLPEDLAKLKSLKTEQGVTNIFVGGEVKPTIEARYALDIASIVSKLQTKLLTLQEEVVKNV